MNIKDIRTRKGLTQAEVASALGVSSVVYSRYETGSRQPSIDILIQLADIFGVTVDYLLGRQDIEDSTLSEYELSLLIASRKANERAKQDALNFQDVCANLFHILMGIGSCWCRKRDTGAEPFFDQLPDFIFQHPGI